MNRWIAFLLVFLAGCAAQPSRPYYVAPGESPGVSQVVGSQTTHTGLKASERVFLVAVDGLPLLREQCGFSKPMRVNAGQRALRVSYIRAEMHAEATLEADIPSNDKIVIKHQLASSEKAVRLWLESSSGAVLREAGPLELKVHRSAAGAPPFFAMLNMSRECP